MTLRKLMNLYEHYKKHYEFTLSKMSYQELDKKANHKGEMFLD